jgi:hypothetical protein
MSLRRRNTTNLTKFRHLTCHTGPNSWQMIKHHTCEVTIKKQLMFIKQGKSKFDVCGLVKFEWPCNIWCGLVKFESICNIWCGLVKFESICNIYDVDWWNLNPFIIYDVDWWNLSSFVIYWCGLVKFEWPCNIWCGLVKFESICNIWCGLVKFESICNIWYGLVKFESICNILVWSALQTRASVLQKFCVGNICQMSLVTGVTTIPVTNVLSVTSVTTTPVTYFSFHQKSISRVHISLAFLEIHPSCITKSQKHITQSTQFIFRDHITYIYR